jgi:hypothetical protein
MMPLIFFYSRCCPKRFRITIIFCWCWHYKIVEQILPRSLVTRCSTRILKCELFAITIFHVDLPVCSLFLIFNTFNYCFIIFWYTHFYSSHLPTENSDSSINLSWYENLFREILSLHSLTSLCLCDKSIKRGRDLFINSCFMHSFSPFCTLSRIESLSPNAESFLPDIFFEEMFLYYLSSIKYVCHLSRQEGGAFISQDMSHLNISNV